MSDNTRDTFIIIILTAITTCMIVIAWGVVKPAFVDERNIQMLARASQQITGIIQRHEQDISLLKDKKQKEIAPQSAPAQ